MGCCVSTQDEQRRRHLDDGAPPPGSASPVEEETVKELLLETPIMPKPASGSETSEQKPVENQKYLKAEIEPARVIEIPHRQMPSEEKEVTVSEVSEMCSFRESVSNTTAPGINDDANGGEVNQSPRPAGKVKDRGGDRRRFPSKRPTAPSPGKITAALLLRTVCAQARNVETGKESRREGGVQSERMWKRGEEGAHRSVSKRVDGGGGNDGMEAADDAVSGDPEAESLENPVVSLECFILL